MKCKKVLAVSVIFSLFMANIAYAANPKVEIAYRGSVEDGLEIKYDDGTVKYADDNVMLMMINGDLISNANIIIKNGTTLVPLRIISEQLKADVAWNAKTKTITIVKGNNTIEMKVGNKSAKLNNKSFKMNVAPQIINGYTYVPIRAVAECFNADDITYEIIYQGEVADVPEQVQAQVEPRHAHKLVDITLKEHKKKSNGSCVTTYYEGQKCSTCGTVWKGDVINTVTMAKCTH